MPWTVKYAADTGVVIVTASGQIRNEDAAAQAAETLRLVKQNEASLILADYLDALSEVSLPSLYELPDYYSRIGAPGHARIAVVLPRTGYRLDSYQFFELVCKNAGYNVQLFESKAAAEQWLAQASAIPEPAGSPAHA